MVLGTAERHAVCRGYTGVYFSGLHPPHPGESIERGVWGWPMGHSVACSRTPRGTQPSLVKSNHLSPRRQVDLMDSYVILMVEFGAGVQVIAAF